MRLRVVCDEAAPHGEQIRVEDADTGAVLEDVVSIKWEAEVDDAARVTIVTNAHAPANLVGEGEARGCLCDHLAHAPGMCHGPRDGGPMGARCLCPELGPGKVVSGDLEPWSTGDAPRSWHTHDPLDLRRALDVRPATGHGNKKDELHFKIHVDGRELARALDQAMARLNLEEKTAGVVRSISRGRRVTRVAFNTSELAVVVRLVDPRRVRAIGFEGAGRDSALVVHFGPPLAAGTRRR